MIFNKLFYVVKQKKNIYVFVFSLICNPDTILNCKQMQKVRSKK